MPYESAAKISSRLRHKVTEYHAAKQCAVVTNAVPTVLARNYACHSPSKSVDRLVDGWQTGATEASSHYSALLIDKKQISLKGSTT